MSLMTPLGRRALRLLRRRRPHPATRAPRPVEDVALHALDDRERAAVHRWFDDHAFAALTPTAIDSLHPIPRLRPGSLHLLALLRRPDVDGPLHALVVVPAALDRPHELRTATRTIRVSAADLLRLGTPSLFNGLDLERVASFRVVDGAMEQAGRWPRLSERPRQSVTVSAGRADAAHVQRALGDHLDLTVLAA